MEQRPSSMLWIAGMVWMIVVFPLSVYVYHYAYTAGLPSSVHPNFWLLFVALEFLVVLIHELGHALAVWAVHYRLKMISVGPVTMHRDGHGRWQWRFDWRRVLKGGGCIRAIPHSSLDPDLRGNAMIVLFAGPLMTLIFGAVLFLLFINLPGTALAGWWEAVALGVVLFTASFFRNLTPVGITDGNRLLQLALRNQAGEEFLKLFVASVDDDRAEKSKAILELDDEIASRTRVLEQMLTTRGGNRLPLAAAYHYLGIAQFHAVEWEAAEASMNSALEIVERARDPHPALEGNIWLVLCYIHCGLHQLDRAQASYGRAISTLEQAEKKGGGNSVQLGLVVASLHLHMGLPELALDKIESACANLALGEKEAMNRSTMLRLRAECDFALGCPERGLAAAREAAGLLRSRMVLESEGRQAAAQLMALGDSLWNYGQSAEGILVTSEAVVWLEANDARRFAARCRLGLAGMLGKEGRLAEAESALPSDTDLPENKKPVLCTVRARIRLAQRRFEDARNDFDCSLQSDRGASDDGRIKLALDKNGLARALFYLGRVEEAERQAREALEILLPPRHPDASETLITLALIGWQCGAGDADEQFEKGLQCIVEAPLLKPANKARSLQDEVRFLRDHRRTKEAARAEEEAREQWRLAGVETSTTESLTRQQFADAPI